MKKLNRVYQKIENDYQDFKNEMLAQDTGTVFDRAYKIFCINEIYHVLTNSYKYTVENVSVVLNFKGNILEQIYDEWLHNDYTHQDLFEDTIGRTFTLFRQEMMERVERMPDDSISIEEMQKYGYRWDGMFPMRKTAARKVIKHCSVYRLFSDNAESLVASNGDLLSHAENGGIFGVEKDTWKTAVCKIK